MDENEKEIIQESNKELKDELDNKKELKPNDDKLIEKEEINNDTLNQEPNLKDANQKQVRTKRKKNIVEEEDLKLNSEEDLKIKKEKKIPKKIKKPEVSEEKIEAFVIKFKEKLLRTVEEDNKNNKEKKPAMGKLNIIDEVVKTLLNKSIQQKMLEFGILEVLKKWLEPLPDKTLPNILIKRNILEVLLTFSVTRNQLVDSGIGKIVYFYSINHKEIKEIRKLANSIVQKWIKLVSSADEDDL